jgi:hypothetical protein
VLRLATIPSHWDPNDERIGTAQRGDQQAPAFRADTHPYLARPRWGDCLLSPAQTPGRGASQNRQSRWVVGHWPYGVSPPCYSLSQGRRDRAPLGRWSRSARFVAGQWDKQGEGGPVRVLRRSILSLHKRREVLECRRVRGSAGSGDCVIQGVGAPAMPLRAQSRHGTSQD